MDPRKKDRERRVLQRFLEKLNQEDFLGIEEANSEPPDFIIKMPDGLASLEITDIIDPRLKQAESAQEKIIHLAKKYFKIHRSDLLRVYVIFTNRQLDFNSKFIKELALELSQYIIEVCKNNERHHFEIETMEYPQFHKYFKEICVTNKTNYENWQTFGAFYVPNIDLKWFVSKIQLKERILNRYSSRFDQNLLLLAMDFGHESSSFTFDSDTIHGLQTNFDRIYIYQYFANSISRIK